MAEMRTRIVRPASFLTKKSQPMYCLRIENLVVGEKSRTITFFTAPGTKSRTSLASRLGSAFVIGSSTWPRRLKL